MSHVNASIVRARRSGCCTIVSVEPRALRRPGSHSSVSGVAVSPTPFVLVRVVRYSAGQRLQRTVEGGAWSHCGGGLGVVGAVVPAEVDGSSLHGEQLVDDLVLAVRQRIRQPGEARRQLRVVGLLREFL